MTAVILRNAKTLMVLMIVNAMRVFVDVDLVMLAVLILMNAQKKQTSVTPTQPVKTTREHTLVNVSMVSLGMGAHVRMLTNAECEFTSATQMPSVTMPQQVHTIANVLMDMLVMVQNAVISTNVLKIAIVVVKIPTVSTSKEVIHASALKVISKKTLIQVLRLIKGKRVQSRRLSRDDYHVNSYQFKARYCGYHHMQSLFQNSQQLFFYMKTFICLFFLDLRYAKHAFLKWSYDS